MYRGTDIAFMRQAMAHADQSFNNYKVGALLVFDNTILSAGYRTADRLVGALTAVHHAEDNALSNAEYTKNTTLYTTLEPCTCRARNINCVCMTPCAQLISQAGVKRVVVGILDPNPAINGRGVQHLRKKGIQVDVLSGLEQQLRRLIH